MQYKYIINHTDGTVTWEGGNNHQITTPSDGNTGSVRITVATLPPPRRGARTAAWGIESRRHRHPRSRGRRGAGGLRSRATARGLARARALAAEPVAGRGRRRRAHRRPGRTRGRGVDRGRRRAPRTSARRRRMGHLVWGYVRRYRGTIPGRGAGVVHYALGVGDVEADGGRRQAYVVGDGGPPAWAADAIVYQVWVDRFSSTGGMQWPSGRQLARGPLRRHIARATRAPRLHRGTWCEHGLAQPDSSERLRTTATT